MVRTNDPNTASNQLAVRPSGTLGRPNGRVRQTGSPRRTCRRTRALAPTGGLLAMSATRPPAALVDAPPTVVLTSGAGLVTHLARAQQAHRAGTCILRDTRLVLVYLVVAFAAGVVGTVRPWLS
jgi:hypothetical protein